MLKIFFDVMADDRSAFIMDNISRVATYKALEYARDQLVSKLEACTPKEVHSLLVDYDEDLQAKMFAANKNYYKGGYMAGVLEKRTGKDFFHAWPKSVMIDNMVSDLSKTDEYLQRCEKEARQRARKLHQLLDHDERARSLLLYFKDAHGACESYVEKVCYRAGRYDSMKYGDIIDPMKIIV